MVHFSCVSIFVMLNVISCSRCWVFNNVNYAELAGKSTDMADDMHNEIEADEFAQQKLSLIYPGTKWCGAGSIADGYDDLGPANETDKCCREHDNCPDTIAAGDTMYNLTNNAFYTRLNCKCDEEFRKCLRTANTRTARIIGKTYFNALGTKCFRCDYPVTGCIQYGGWLNKKCTEHSYNTTGTPLYQWFDVPNF